MLSTSNEVYLNYFKLRYYSKITNISKILKQNKKEKIKYLPAELGNNNNNIKKSKIKENYTKKLIYLFLYNKKIQQLNLNITNKITNTSKNKNIIMNLEVNKLIKLQTDITLYNTLNLINLTF